MKILQVTYDAIDDGIAQSIQSATSALLTLQRGRSLQLSKHVTKAVAAPGVNEVGMVWSRFALFRYLSSLFPKWIIYCNMPALLSIDK